MSALQSSTEPVAQVSMDASGDTMLNFESPDVVGAASVTPDDEVPPSYTPPHFAAADVDTQGEGKRNRMYFIAASVLLALTGLIVVVRKPVTAAKPQTALVDAAPKANDADDADNSDEVDGVSGVANELGSEPATPSGSSITQAGLATGPTGAAGASGLSDTRAQGGATGAAVPARFETTVTKSDTASPKPVETKTDADSAQKADPLTKLTYLKEEDLDNAEPDCSGKKADAPKVETVAVASTNAPAAASASAKNDAKSIPTPDTTERKPAPAPIAKAQAQATLKEAGALEQKDGANTADLEQARWLYQRALESGGLDADESKSCEARLEALANKLILSPKLACSFPKAIFHTVEAGDSAERIARKYKVNIGQVKLINKLNDKLVVKTGQSLKLLPGPVVFKVNRTDLTGTLYIDGVLIRRFPVGIGPGNATPVGKYNVQNKVTNPDWYYDGQKVPFGDPVNILGTRWMGFLTDDNAAGLGIHGTSLPESVPGRESKGCVRMHNADVEELYDLMPQGGSVEITN